MGNMHLVTGYQGQEHITAADHGSLYSAIFGSGSYVLDRGNKLAASVITNNQVRIADGDLVIQGRHVRLNEGATVDLTIENGAQGYKRNDLVVARYTRNASSGIEEVNLVVIKGTGATADPADPAHIIGDILTDHAETADFPLYRIPLDGLSVGTPVRLMDVAYLVTLGSDKKISAEYLPAMNYIPTSQKGARNGVASLDSTGKVPSGQLPEVLPTGLKTFALTSTANVNSANTKLYWYQVGQAVFFSVHINFVRDTPSGERRLTFSGLPTPTNGMSTGLVVAVREYDTFAYSPVDALLGIPATGEAWMDITLPDNTYGISFQCAYLTGS